MGGCFWDCCANVTPHSQEDHDWIIFLLVTLGSDTLHPQFIEEESVIRLHEEHAC